ncbi:MAG: rhodanese-like domain-containing protein [Burkholderiaceae bacterium]
MDALLSPAGLRQLIRSRQPFALLDIREPGEFGRGHLLLASNAAAGRLEWTIDARVPARGVPVVLCADWEGPQAHDALLRLRRASDTLRAMGYRDLRLLEGGPAAWAASGFEVFTGFNVPSKTFGERLEQVRQTPHIEAAALHEQLETGRVVVVDCRPRDEHLRGAVPGAMHLPGVELAARLEQLPIDEGTTVVVHCAGRTRGIVATQSLIDLQYRRPIAVLNNGLIGWELAGLALSRPAQVPAAFEPLRPSPSLLQRARERAERTGVRRLDAQAWRTMASLGDDGGHRALYCFDVRDADEYAAGHAAGFRHVPGGQLLQSLDDHAAVRGGTIVLFDVEEVRALVAAAYLREMGWDEVYVLDREAAQTAIADRSQPAAAREDLRETAPELEPAQFLTASELARSCVAEGAECASWPIIDLGPSPAYRQQHLPRARFAARGLLHRFVPQWRELPGLILVCEDGRLSALTAPALQAELGRPVQVLRGGTCAWQRAGLPLSSEADWLTDPVDVATTPYDYEGDVHRQMQAYIDWELELVGKAERDGSLSFRI